MANSISRRDFLKGMAAAGVLGAAGTLVGCSQTSAQPTATPTAAPTAEPYAGFETTVKWDAEYDVVVLGYGGAGATAAITAADAGAKTLLIEKAPKGHEGGNTRYSGQGIGCPQVYEDSIKYYQGLRGGYSNMTDDIIETFVKNAMENKDWIINTLEVEESRVGGFIWNEFPEFPGGETNECLLIDNERFSGKLWQALVAAVEKRDIDIWFESPGYKLVQDPITKIIHGVTIKNNGATYNVRAKNGVVLATGGFENNKDFIQYYVQMPEAYSKGARYNEGDAIKMATECGAMLWHMSSMAGCDPNFVIPDTNVAAAYSNNSGTSFFGHEAILVGGDGTRFMNEAVSTNHGHVKRHGTWISLPIPQNAWAVYDATCFNTIAPYASFTAGSDADIDKGWVVKADTLEELAGLMNVDADGLVAEVARYNKFCATGVDEDWGRAADYLKPLKTAPYYAYVIKPTFTNTQGGPMRNTDMQIVTAYGDPIPHLYAAGENGSIFTDIYQGGSNLAECLVSGRISGTNAATVKDDVTQDDLLTANAIDFSVKENTDETLGANQYAGTGTGIGGELDVVVTYENGEITNVEVTKNNETEGYGSRAIASMPAEFVGCKTADDVGAVDGVSGATTTSKALREAVTDALSKVK